MRLLPPQMNTIYTKNHENTSFRQSRFIQEFEHQSETDSPHRWRCQMNLSRSKTHKTGKTHPDLYGRPFILHDQLDDHFLKSKPKNFKRFSEIAGWNYISAIHSASLLFPAYTCGHTVLSARHLGITVMCACFIIFIKHFTSQIICKTVHHHNNAFEWLSFNYAVCWHTWMWCCRKITKMKRKREKKNVLNYFRFGIVRKAPPEDRTTCVYFVSLDSEKLMVYCRNVTYSSFLLRQLAHCLLAIISYFRWQ